ncbi:MAG: glycosyltransferase family 4 protein [Chloroflexi bacterium]|nr:glycosyltransferase family 4 protein [Chloroflexota bacterium]
MEAKLTICMLLPIRYGANMRVNPQIGIASYLVNFGHKITWVLSAESSRVTQQATLNRIEIYAAAYIRYLGETFLPGKAFNRVLAMLKKMRLALSVFREGGYDLVFIRDDTFDGLLATYLKRRYRIPLVYELSSPLEEEWEGYKMEGKKLLFLWYLVAKIKARLKIYIMKKADLVLPTTRWFEEELVEKGIAKAKLMPFPNGVDIASFAGKEGSEIKERYHLSEAKVLIYLGVMAKQRKLEVLIRAFSRVKETKEKVKLLMVGDGTGRKDLEKLVAELGIKDDVIFTGQVPQSEVPSFLAAADIGIDPRPPLSYYVVSSPIKTFEYMAMGKPVVVSIETRENKEVIEQSEGGILVAFSAESFACAIIELLDNPEKAREMGRKGYEWLVANRSFEILARKLEDRLSQLQGVKS